MAKRIKKPRESIWQRLARRISGDPTPAGKKPGKVSGPVPATRKKAAEEPAKTQVVLPDAAAELSAFEKELRSIATAQSSITAGRLQMLNVEHVAAHFGNKWPKMIDRVHGIIERALRNHLGKRDIFRRHRQLFYVVVFAEIGGAEARARMALVSNEINIMLFGDEDDLTALELRGAVFDVDGKVVLEAYSVADAIGAYAASQVVESQLAEADSPAEPDPDADPDAADQASDADDDDDDGEHAPAGRIAMPIDDDAKLREVERAHEMIKNRLEQIQTIPGEDKTRNVEFRMLCDLEDDLLRLHDRLAQRIPLVEREEPVILKTAAGTVDEESTYPRPATLLLMEAENTYMANDHDQRVFVSEDHDLSLRFSYRPVWHVDAKVIGTYFVTAYFLEAGVEKTAERAFRKKLSPDINALIDRCLLRRALHDLAATDRGATSIICVPVHFTTLRHISHRHSLQNLLHGIPVWCRDHLAWEIIGAPPDTLRTHIEEVMSVLRPFGRTVVWRTALQGDKLANFGTGLISCASVHLRDSVHEETQVFAKMNAWSASAEAVRLKSYLRGADTRSLAVAAVSAGFDRIAGDAVSERIDTFKGVTPFTTENLYMSLVSEAFEKPE